MRIQRNTIFITEPLEVLKRLDGEQFKLVYIDPPYIPENHQWEYEDNLGQVTTLSAYWTYLTKILQQAYRVILESGFLFLEIDAWSPFNAHLFLDRIFGKDNFKGEIIWKYHINVGTSTLTPNYSKILIFGKSKQTKFQAPLRSLSKEEIIHLYPHKEKKGRYRLLSLTTRTPRKIPDFEWNDYSPTKGTYWRYSESALDRMLKEGLIEFSKTGIPRRKVFLSSEKVEAGFVWEQSKGIDLTEIVPKFERLLEMASLAGDLVFAPFSGLPFLTTAVKNGRTCAITLSNSSKDIATKASNNSIWAFHTIENQELQIHPIIHESDGLNRLVETDLQSFSRPNLTNAGRKFAILIGINHYTDPAFIQLEKCVNDVTYLSGVLQRAGYSVNSLFDNDDKETILPTKANIISELSQVAQNISPDDTLFVHFSCHGTRINEEPVLISRDTRRNTIHLSGLHFSEIEAIVRASRARRQIITLDVCQAGVNLGRGIAPDFIVNVNENAEGFALLAASTAQQFAYEPDGMENGLFSHFLIEGVQGRADLDGKNYVTVDDLRGYTLNAIRNWNLEHGSIQDPTYSIIGIGDMIIADYRQ